MGLCVTTILTTPGTGEVMGTIYPSKDGTMSRADAHPPLSVYSCLVILIVFHTIGCSLARVPPAFSRAELSLRTAVEARADEFAPMELQRARERLERSKKAMAAGQYDDARRLAETAQVEAELAEAKADAEITRLAADTLRQRGDALRQEIERGVIHPPAASKE
jgi:uncharacterized protein DUF4398